MRLRYELAGIRGSRRERPTWARCHPCWGLERDNSPAWAATTTSWATTSPAQRFSATPPWPTDAAFVLHPHMAHWCSKKDGREEICAFAQMARLMPPQGGGGGLFCARLRVSHRVAGGHHRPPPSTTKVGSAITTARTLKRKYDCGHAKAAEQEAAPGTEFVACKRCGVDCVMQTWTHWKTTSTI